MNRLNHSDRSEVVRETLEEKVRKEEVEQTVRVMNESSRKAKPEKLVAEIIRGFRDHRRR